MTAYYNEFEPYAAAMLRNLITAGHIADGVVDTRSIEDVRPSDLTEFTQCHFFAGVGVWSYALRAAGWPDDRPVWTGSCPCQPFSAAGKGLAFADERHLWPTFGHLIKERRPAVVFGEQVASKDVDAWIDLVHADLEAMGYAFGSVPFPSASVGAPHIRDRNYWAAVGLADSNDARLEGRRGMRERSAKRATGPRGVVGRLADTDSGRGEGGAELREPSDGIHGCPVGGLADTHCGAGGQGRADVRGWIAGGDAQPWAGSGSSSMPQRLADHDKHGRGAHAGRELHDAEHHVESCGGAVGLADSYSGERHGVAVVRRAERDGQDAGWPEGSCELESRSDDGDAKQTNGFWRAADWLGCRDGKWRPVEPGTFPLVDGAPSRVGRLRAYGNAINAEQARIWIETVMEYLA